MKIEWIFKWWPFSSSLKHNSPSGRRWQERISVPSPSLLASDPANRTHSVIACLVTIWRVWTRNPCFDNIIISSGGDRACCQTWQRDYFSRTSCGIRVLWSDVWTTTVGISHVADIIIVRRSYLRKESLSLDARIAYLVVNWIRNYYFLLPTVFSLFAFLHDFIATRVADGTLY